MPTRWTSTVLSIRTPARFSRSVRFSASPSICSFAPHRTNARAPNTLSGTTVPHTVEGDSFKDSGRARIPPPLERHDYLPDLIAEKAKSQGKEWDVRRDLKPLHVQQPLGVSFSWVLSFRCDEW
jgi:hypothetical protein